METPTVTLMPIPGTTCYIPWGVGEGAQVLMELYKDDGAPNPVDPRQLAKGVVKQFDSLGFRLSIAFELEFYLIDENLDDQGRPRFPGMKTYDGQHYEPQVYSLDDLDQQLQVF